MRVCLMNTLCLFHFHTHKKKNHLKATQSLVRSRAVGIMGFQMESEKTEHDECLFVLRET